MARQPALMMRQPPSMTMTGRMRAGNGQVMLTVGSRKWQRGYIFMGSTPEKVQEVKYTLPRR
jgi:hypothetical protein